MDERTFWVRIWQTIIAGTVLILFSFSGCTIHKNIKISELIRDGYDPVRAKIALNWQSSKSETITALLTSK